jgi:hypothetical protein
MKWQKYLLTIAVLEISGQSYICERTIAMYITMDKVAV